MPLYFLLSDNGGIDCRLTLAEREESAGVLQIPEYCAKIRIERENRRKIKNARPIG